MTTDQRAMLTEPFLFWYHADWNYGLTMIKFFCTAIGVAILFNVLFHIRARSTQALSAKSGVNSRIIALLRYFTSRQYYLRTPALGTWYSPPLASMVSLAGVFMFTTALILGKRPYYWPNLAMGHSMPIATRSGWIAIAIMPFMIALSTKINYIALLTGSSHEKLQVFHRWLAVIMFIPSLVHTFPFIVMSIEDGEMELNWRTSTYYWTGVAALVPQTYLVFASWGIFRNKYYELFKKLHFIAGGIFMAALFVHCCFRLSSWDYFWATLALYATAWLFRIIRTIYNSGISLQAHVTSLTSPSHHQLLHIRVPVSSRVTWWPGQHVFLRFWGLGVPHAFSSHPWTVSSLPSDQEHAIELVLRVHGGITKYLARQVEAKAGSSLAVWVDGPYGGVPGGLAHYDEVVLLAGGSGSTFIMPLVTDLVRQKKNSSQRVHVVLALRSRDDFAWMQEIVGGAQAQLRGGLSVRVHITGDESTSASTPSSDNADLDEGMKGSPTTTFHGGRPVLRQIVRSICSGTSGRVAIAACGPDSFLYDTRNEVAKYQLDIARGTASGSKDVFLHTESYSW